MVRLARHGDYFAEGAQPGVARLRGDLAGCLRITQITASANTRNSGMLDARGSWHPHHSYRLVKTGVVT
jgi:hypothetical protein